jgi:hypothetical protein
MSKKVIVDSKTVQMAMDPRPLEQFVKQNSQAFKGLSRDGVRWAAIRYCKAARAATKVAPKKRRIVKNAKKAGNKTATRNKNQNLFYAQKKMGSGKPDVYIPIVARSKEIARADPRATITKRGLAANTWRWMIGRIGGAGAKPGMFTNPGAFATDNKGRFMRVTNNLRKFNPEMRLLDKLDYATEAMYGSRKGPNVHTVVQRTINNMDAQIKRNIRAKRGKTGSRSGMHRG